MNNHVSNEKENDVISENVTNESNVNNDNESQPEQIATTSQESPTVKLESSANDET